MRPVEELSGTDLEIYAARFGLKRRKTWFWYESDRDLRERIAIARDR